MVGIVNTGSYQKKINVNDTYSVPLLRNELPGNFYDYSNRHLTMCSASTITIHAYSNQPATKPTQPNLTDYFERTRPAASMRPPCLIYLYTSVVGWWVDENS